MDLGFGEKGIVENFGFFGVLGDDIFGVLVVFLWWILKLNVEVRRFGFKRRSRRKDNEVFEYYK